MAELERWSGDGRLHLEPDTLTFRGAERLSIPLSEITGIHDADGWLVVEHAGGTARFDLGHLAPAWLNAITRPRTRMDRLAVDATSLITCIGDIDDELVRELRAIGAEVHDAPAEDAAYDVVLLAADDEADLQALPRARAVLSGSGAVWVIHPRGAAAVQHDTIVAAARAAGLVENRSARLSPTHAALRLVSPGGRRAARD